MRNTHEPNNLNSDMNNDTTIAAGGAASDSAARPLGLDGPDGPDAGTPEAQPPADVTRSLRYWLRSVDRLLAREIDQRFAEAGASRRDLRVLSMLSREGGMPEKLRERLERLERLERHGKRLWSLADRGWIEQSGAGWRVTDTGAEAQKRLAEISRDVRERVAGAVSPDALATTVASLEAMARDLSGEDALPQPHGMRGFGRRRGRGRSFGHGHAFGQGHSHSHSHGHGHECGAFRGDRHAEAQQPPARGAHHRVGRREAFERGFSAGFTAARSDG